MFEMTMLISEDSRLPESCASCTQPIIQLVTTHHTTLGHKLQCTFYGLTGILSDPTLAAADFLGLNDILQISPYCIHITRCTFMSCEGLQPRPHGSTLRR